MNESLKLEPSSKLDSIKNDTDVDIVAEKLEFNHKILPQKVAPFVFDVADRMNKAPISFAGTSALSVLSSAIGRRVGVRPKLHDNWTVTPNLWGMLIAPPSIKKSPIYSECMTALKKAEFEEYEIFKEEQLAYNEALVIYGLELKAFKKAKEKGEGEVSMPTEPERPKRVRYLLNDATIEMVADIMIDNPLGLMLTLDELSGWFATLSKAGREGDRSFWLEAFNGNDSKNIDRIGRGSSFVPFVCASIFGTIQPDVVSDVIFSTNKGASGGDGLLQRFQLMVIENETNWEYVDRQPNYTAKQEYADLIKKLLQSDPLDFGAKKDDYDDDIIFYRFSKDANKVFETFCKELHKKISRESEHNPALSAHLGKYEGFFASLALILFYSDKISGVTSSDTIPLEYANKAKELCNFYESQARLVYDIERFREEKKDALSEKIIDKISELQTLGKLPLSYGKIAQKVFGAKSKDIEEAVKGIAVIQGRKIYGLK